MFISYEDFKKTDDYQSFIGENPDIGYLKVQAFTAYGAIPISDAQILITKDIGGNKVVFFQGLTNSSGIIENIQLPAPAMEPLTENEVAPKYTTYNLTAIHEGYEAIKQYTIGMFGGIKVIQYVKMTPEINLEGAMQNGN